jgi:hypothetical protein
MSNVLSETFTSPECRCRWTISVNETDHTAECLEITETCSDSLFPTPCPDRCDIKVSKILDECKSVLFSGAVVVRVSHPLSYWDFRDRLRVTPERIARRRRQELLWSCSACKRACIPEAGWSCRCVAESVIEEEEEEGISGVYQEQCSSCT